MTAIQTTGLGRNTIDKYYTRDTVVAMCLSAVAQHIDISPGDICIEPSAGKGAFIDGIKRLFAHFRFYDIIPEHPEIICQDYLTGTYTDLSAEFGKVHVIGNPPFGRQASLAIWFIKKSCEFCESVSFILPRSFKKASRHKTFPARFHLVYELNLPADAFLVECLPHCVPCVFQIWVKRPYSRPIAMKLTPAEFVFVLQSALYDVSVRRVGVNAGQVCLAEDSAHKSRQSHYFIKFTNTKSREDNVHRLLPIVYDTNNTVGPKSISKQELIAKFNAALS